MYVQSQDINWLEDDKHPMNACTANLMQNTFGVKKCSQVKWNHTWKWIHEQIVDNKIWYQNTAKGKGA